jgi:hypothetical protein
MVELNFDASSLRDWMASVGLLRIVSDMSEARIQWRLARGRYRPVVRDAPDKLAERCAQWVADNRAAWHLAGAPHDEFDAQFWRAHAIKAKGLEAPLWCALMSDAVMRQDHTRPQATALKFGFGGEKSGKNWLPRMRKFLNGAVTSDHFERLLRGERDESMAGDICRWDPACHREHAYRAKAPTADKMSQDQTINALAVIGLTSCPSAPRRGQLVTPLVTGKQEFTWPVWTDALRIADLEAALCCGWAWPTVRARWWIDQVFYVARGEFGELREPELSAEMPVGSREQISA